ncbi:MAG: hypothetical protein KAU07_03110 [Candidatus Andersenbacteria bacterium]|nr:hypothetical protein [Candidatus Andersenbacteria bacterium]
MNQIIKLPKLDDYTAQKEREEFLIVKARMIKETEKTIEIIIDDNPETASNIAERRIISDPKPENGSVKDIRFAAGGLGIIIKTPGRKHLMATVRVSKSSFDCHLTSFTGLGCKSEITNPKRTAVRKGIEDLIIVVNDKVIVPQFNDDSFLEINIKAIVQNGATLYEKTKNLPRRETEARMLNLPNEKEFKICWRNNEYTYQGLPVHDHGTRGLDFIKLMILEFNEKIENIKFLDGRIMGGKNLLNRDIYALELDKNFNWNGEIGAGWKSGKLFTPPEGINFPQTPILKTILKELAERK